MLFVDFKANNVLPWVRTLVPRTDSAVLLCGVTEVFWERIFLKNVLDSSQCLQIRCEFILWYLCMSELPKLQKQWVYACMKWKNANQNWEKRKILLVSPISRKYKENPWNVMTALWNYLDDTILYQCRWLGYAKVSIFPGENNWHTFETK